MDTDTVSSGTKLFYQVRSSDGTDSKSVMKLVPVKIATGKSIQNQPKDGDSPALLVATLISPQRVSSVNVTHNKTSLGGRSTSVGLPVCLTPVTTPRQNQFTTNAQMEMSHSVQKNIFITTSSLKPPQSHTTTVGPGLSSAVPAPKHLSSVAPVAVIGPVLPRASNFQMPTNVIFPSSNQSLHSPHSTVLYASPMTNINQSVNPELLLRKHRSDLSPVAVKVKALSSKAPSCFQKPSSANFFAKPAQPTVVYVTLPNSSVTPPSDYTPNTVKTFSSVSNKSIRKNTSNKPLTLIPKFSQRPNSPIKWVVEEENSSLPSLISPSIASEVLEVVAKREQANKDHDTIPVRHLVGQTNAINNAQKPKDTIVMCDDKVFFVVKKSKTSTDELKEPTSLKEGMSEVIDLCDGDVQGTALTEMAVMSCPSEDNVEFVSYIPPQTKSSSGKGTTNKVSQKQKGPLDKAGVGRRCPQKSTGQKEGHTLSTTKPSLAAESMVDDASIHVETEQSSSREKMNSHNMEISGASHDVTSAAPSPLADHILKQTFGITSEVKISLDRIDVSSADTHRSLVIKVPDLDYMEPIDDDFPCTADILISHHSQNCPEVKPSSSRVVRTRKRTKCPCCSPATLHRHQAQKRRAKPAEGDKRETVRKQLKLSGLMSCEINSTPVTVASDCLFKLAMDSEELQIHEQIQILREALRLKEAALEKLKNDKNG